ncbi:hypothetical protein [Bradyrhizobium sp. WD16]|uniref:hypothetical protein n=1 Tax=Bradyrhizobium sp. WD16 TaxID=1521768 RepID=UPI0020A234E9|nr:hypothetical protein [Bradyrhizobium sp. WD16]UTD29316.1 hypothetical protein DB459_22800 [Bradyrhizobium sp. WD16]
MRTIRLALGLLLLGVLLLVIGLIWIGQGTGTFPYPAASFMIRQMQWAWIGGAVALVGLVLVVLSRRR